jgi:hypothetical protein
MKQSVFVNEPKRFFWKNRNANHLITERMVIFRRPLPKSGG